MKIKNDDEEDEDEEKWIECGKKSEYKANIPEKRSTQHERRERERVAQNMKFNFIFSPHSAMNQMYVESSHCNCQLAYIHFIVYQILRSVHVCSVSTLFCVPPASSLVWLLFLIFTAAHFQSRLALLRWVIFRRRFSFPSLLCVFLGLLGLFHELVYVCECVVLTYDFYHHHHTALTLLML